MGTMAAFYASNPATGGSLIGTVGLDGHPDNMLRIARSTSYKAYRAAVRAVKARERAYWWTPQRIWWTWPSNGLIVHDFSYWWDEERQAAMVARYQFGPVAFTEEVARDSELWPKCNQASLNPDLVGIPLPEFFATVDPWDLPDTPVHSRHTAYPTEGEAAERLFTGPAERDVVLERLPGAVGTWSRNGAPDLFHIHSGDDEARARSVTSAALAVALRNPYALGPKGYEAHGAFCLYSVEDFLQECRFGPVRIARGDGGRRFTVEADHPLAGAIRTEDDTLAKALVLARRALLATPGFHLHGSPPTNMKHRGNDPEPVAV